MRPILPSASIREARRHTSGVENLKSKNSRKNREFSKKLVQELYKKIFKNQIYFQIMIYILLIIFILSQIVARSQSEQILLAFIFAIIFLGLAILQAEKIEKKEDKRKKYCYNFTK